ncbi:hypothetical protein EN814_09815 [Mesorhizobium sp. M2D.F.Ca.ET.171.01.1.1]|uniref:hypothetical protein n=1 Tax=unclassified Mesorhizobium TaxID=325217 RepID=UPI000FCA43E2|nr:MULTISPECIES: hypothetical protein [unclassified Mesorhizobium]TGT97827.1 hypothetical protein EN806_48470 [bacterium M00.F.Ca.ET.163.01.1.1]TGU44606.1 hypothetical protein EN789_21625 [bacterium M00.F.Ca.ET.146.01.1.1]TGW09942.1 hypothetical protein EN788_22075 [Mesorhizobium sp. M2D.F.Ca.ET.145.01.1.1]TGP27968.1 hypothetical protein EN875_032940 [Mesorhizobium sp. M2D.F.Ca.ET.232.01.1.1]TGQ25557.1 hypothetical protein EN863_057145 [Mesorhizobium sp. M00.F.Ca.ET.220.01.1.1]
MAEILKSLDNLIHDWDGREMADGETTRIDVDCGTIRAAIDKIEGLEADLDSAVEVAWKRGATDWVRMNYPKHYERFTTGENPA